MIYLLEDDDSIRDFVIYTLNSQGMEAKGFPLPSLFWQAVGEQLPSLVLLDIMLPEEDGLSVLKKLRAAPRTAKLPVIMLTAKGTEYDKVIGLDGGADDYVAKPFGMMELLSRIRALLRRTETENGTLRCGILEVDPGQHIVRVRGQETILTQKEFEVLCLLLRNPGQVLSREQLIENVWGYAFTGESRTVDVHSLLTCTSNSRLRPLCGSMAVTESRPSSDRQNATSIGEFFGRLEPFRSNVAVLMGSRSIGMRSSSSSFSNTRTSTVCWLSTLVPKMRSTR